MDIERFLKKNIIVDPRIDQYDAVQISQLNRIVGGEFDEKHDELLSGDPILENYAGLYYLYEKQNYCMAVRYFNRAIEKGNIDALNNMGVLYVQQEKYDLAKSYYQQAMDLGNPTAVNGIGWVYFKQEKYDLAERHMLVAVARGDVNAMHNIGDLYSKQQKYDLAERHLLMAIEHGSVRSMQNLGYIYKQMGKYDLAERYYLQAIYLGNVTAMHNLAYMYKELKKYDQAERYYLMTLSKGIDNLEPTIRCLDHLIGNPLRLFVVLDRLKSSNDVVVQKLKELMKNQTVRYFANKRNRLSKDGECPVCYDERRLIPRECAHYYCEDCYVRIDRCCFSCDDE